MSAHREFDQEDQPMFLVLGGRVDDPQGSVFRDLSALDMCGVFPSYEEAFTHWRGRAQATVDDAFMKYMIVRLR